MADTATVTLTSASFTDLGAVPLIVENISTEMLYVAVAASQPSASAIGHLVPPRDVDWGRAIVGATEFAGDTRHVWARVHAKGGETTSAKVIVTGAP